MDILITSVVDLMRSAPNRLHYFVRHLSRNHRVTVLCIKDHWKESVTSPHAYGFQFYNDTLRHVDLRYVTQSVMPPVYQEALCWYFRGVLEGIRLTRFDVHFNYGSLLLGYLVARRMRARGKVVFDIADDLAAMVRTSPQLPLLAKPLAGIISDVAFRQNVSLADIVTVANSTLTRSLGISLDKAVIVPNGVDLDTFKPTPPAEHLVRSLGLADSFVLGYVGVLREWVDFEGVFQAIAGIKGVISNIKLLIVGEEGGLDKHKSLAARYGIRDQVLFCGSVPPYEVPGYIAAMDVCLVPFRPDSQVANGALPLKLLEYMACGKPVISSRVTGVVEEVGDRVVYASSPQEISQAVIRLYRDKGFRETLGRQGRELIERKYSWSRSCSLLEEVLVSL